MAAERELADDAQWKIIQKNTFTRWTNENLKSAKMVVTDLEKDLSDGLKLIGLIEVLSGKKFGKFNKKPTFRTQKFENVTQSLRFLEEREGIKIVNIGLYIMHIRSLLCIIYISFACESVVILKLKNVDRRFTKLSPMSIGRSVAY